MRAAVPPLPEPDEAHLWRVRLHGAPDEFARLATLLSAEEHVRAGRFRFERDRHRFVIARGRLREVLAAYLECPPAQVAFGYGPRGKPRLAGDGAGTGLTFSLSHTGTHGLVGIARGRRIGVDLEGIRPDVLGDAEASLLLAEAERRDLDRLPSSDRLRALLAAWVQKEAYAKARGDGLALDLRAIEVDVRPDGPGGLRRDRQHADPATRWCVRTLEVGPEFAAALAVEGSAGRLGWWTLPGS